MAVGGFGATDAGAAWVVRVAVGAVEGAAGVVAGGGGDCSTVGPSGFTGLGSSVFTGPDERCTDVVGSVAVTLGAGAGVVLGAGGDVRVGATGLTTTEVTGVTCVSCGAGAHVVRPQITAGMATTAPATNVTRPVNAKTLAGMCFTA